MASERNIQISGLPEIDEIDRAKVLYSLALCYDKIQRLVSNEVLMHAHFKQQRKKGLRRQHDIKLKISYPGKTLVSNAKDWQLITTLQSAIKAIEREAIASVKKD